MNWIVNADFPTPGMIPTQRLALSENMQLTNHRRRQRLACTPSRIEPEILSATLLPSERVKPSYPCRHFESEKIQAKWLLSGVEAR